MIYSYKFTINFPTLIHDEKENNIENKDKVDKNNIIGRGILRTAIKLSMGSKGGNARK